MGLKKEQGLKAVGGHRIERVAHWAFMDHIRQGLVASGRVKPGEKLLIRDAVDGFIGEGEPTGHLLATDGGCFGNNFGLNRIIAYAPWFTYREGYVAKIFADTEYWDDVIGQVPAAIDVVTNVYGIKFDYHCPKNLFEARLVDNPALKDFISRDDEKDSYWISVAGKLWKRPEDLYVGIRFGIVYTQGFRMRHKDTPEAELTIARAECRTLLKQLAGWKGMKYLIQEQGIKLLGLIETELQWNTKINREAAAVVEKLENSADALVNEKQEIYRRAYDRAKVQSSLDDSGYAAAVSNRTDEVYDFTSNEIGRIHEINAAIETIRHELGPYIHEKGRSEDKIADLSCKHAITQYAVDFFID